MSYGFTPVERIRVRLMLDHQDEDANAFGRVDALMQGIVGKHPVDLTYDAQELQDMLMEVIEQWNRLLYFGSREG